MKSITSVVISLFLLQYGFSQNKSEICKIELTLNEFIKTPIQKDCFNISSDSELFVIAFKIKVPGNHSVTIQGNKLNKQVISYLTRKSVKNSIQIFDIKLKDKSIIIPRNIIITLVEN